MGETPGHLDSAPHIAPVSVGDREAQLRHERKRRQQRELLERVFGFLGCLVLLGVIFLALSI